MALADQTAIAQGIDGYTLMESAGRAVADAVVRLFPAASSVLVVCGSGNNGGDGLVVARLLSERGLYVQAWMPTHLPRQATDAGRAMDALDPALQRRDTPDVSAFDVIVDALLGAGLNRLVEGEVAKVISMINTSSTPVVSIDLPSGVDGATGQVLGASIKADATVAFFRYKPGHYLLPGRELCGTRELAQIGIREGVLGTCGFVARHNLPPLWIGDFPVPAVAGHKYNRGHCLVVSGPARFSGAARLAAGAALRVGAGLVSVASPKDALHAHRSQLTAIMVAQADGASELNALLADSRLSCVALGFGLAPEAETRNQVCAVLARGRSTVLDAGALTAFACHPDTLFDAIRQAESEVVLTPHEGEFARLFPALSNLPSKLERAKAAAASSGALVILKGADTVVASPAGDASVADNAPLWLATAGSGDVLAGIVSGLLSQGMPAFKAASAAVWLHGSAAQQLGPALIASDLQEGLRKALQAEVYGIRT